MPTMPSLRILLVLAIVAALPPGCGDGSGDGDARTPRFEVLVDHNRGDGRQAVDAPLNARHVAFDADGNLLLAEYDRVRRVDARTGVIDTVAGTVLSCDGEPSGFGCQVVALTTDRQGRIYEASSDGRILRVGADGVVTHIAGRRSVDCEGAPRYVGPAHDVCFPSIVDMAVDRAGNLYLADGMRSVVSRLDPVRQEVVVAAGDRSAGPCLVDVPATTTCINSPGGIAVDDAGALYIADSPVRRVDPTTGIITSVVGRGQPCEPGPGDDGGPALDACIAAEDVAVDDHGNIYVADRWMIWRVDAATGRIEDFDPERADYEAIAVGPDQRLVSIRKTEDGVATRVVRYDRLPGPGTLVAGNGTPDVCGDGGPARDACLGVVTDLAVGGDATFVADVFATTVRRIDRRGVIERIAGDGRGGFLDDSFPTCDDGPSATDTCLKPPLEVAADHDGNVYMVEGIDYPLVEPYNRVRRVDPSGRIETVIGGCRVSGSIDEVPARDACLRVEALAVGPGGNLYVAEISRVSRLDPESGFLVPVVEQGPACDVFTMLEPECFTVYSIAVGGRGDVYITDSSRIRRFDAATGHITFIAGRREPGTCGDGGPALDACMSPLRMAIADDGDVFLQTSGAIRRIDAATGLIETVAGPIDFACTYDGRSGCITDFALDADGRVVFVESSRRLLRLTLP